MFGGRFSHIRFSLRSVTQSEVAIQAFFVETVDAMIAVGSNVSVETAFRGTVNAEAQLTYGVEVKGSYAETAEARAMLSGNLDIGTIKLTESVSQNTNLGANILEETAFTDSVETMTNLAMNYEIRGNYSEKISADAAMGMNMPESPVYYRESVFAAVSASMPETESFTVTVSVPPGGELRIDSENFSVTLNGENILHLHEGEFMNLDRDILSLYVSSGSEGEIDGKLIYTERYL